MVMGGAATILESLVGPLFKWITLPLLVMAALTFGKIAWDKRDARLMREGEMICDARWREEVRQQERMAAAEAMAAQAETQRKLLESERATTEGLRDELEKIRAESAQLAAASGNDPRCLSDRVLEALRNRQ